MFQKIKQIFSFRKFFRKNKTYSFSPKRDWVILMSLFFIANVILVIGLTFNYFNITSDQGSGVSRDFEKIDSLDEENLQNILNIFYEKENRYQSLSENRPETLDPSI